MKAAKKTKGKVSALQSVKGMRDLIGDQVFVFQGFCEKAAEIALYYGFKPIETPILEKEDLFARGVGQDTDIVSKEMFTLKTKGGDRLVMRPEGTASVMRAYAENGMHSWPQPVMFYYSGPFFRHENPQRGRYRQFYQFGLEILGSPKSILDATIIKLTTTILEESGFNNYTLKINSIGDAECRGAYRRDLVNYYKKNLKGVCADCRERIKTNPLRLLDCKNPMCQEIKKDAPESIASLCGPCKAHFKEVLEYLDAMNIPYEIDSTVVRGLDYYSRTVFEVFVIDQNEDGEQTPLAIGGGGRYDYLAKSLGLKKEIPAVGVSIGVDRLVELPSYVKHAPRVVKKPKVFFIQLSFDAKLRSFEVIEALRKAHIPLTHSISKDSLSAQLAIAEKMNVPYTVILGQKEALEGSVIVRNMDTRSQDTIKINKLADFLKKIK
ncbi:MAG TPA: histidine--tRNA ligase [Candidatus Paceibacterota bacterium]|jgi:histidyl-tRNA synthetase|nr:histidine--tRNA ligase [Candidatus Paceibacterota bacterium]HOH11305.1 histidine--tRNA ligase [Candidatus Paceibacterota bacterium]HOY11105.1 histidine--tRNA ligase [Candidatus Paceibacterota bacterium]HPB60388.1 histidine--tRNA ligase [Candidatus Paceibacterota bacterium]HPN89275.1 histidine--tRNA ligase [Candidatus Paceibacterota bacterium]